MNNFCVKHLTKLYKIPLYATCNILFHWKKKTERDILEKVKMLYTAKTVNVFQSTYYYMQ